MLAALELSFSAVFCAAVINGFIGDLLAWVPVRHTFAGRKIIGAVTDSPFVLPTAVAGVDSIALYAPNDCFKQNRPICCQLLNVHRYFLNDPVVTATANPNNPAQGSSTKVGLIENGSERYTNQ